MIPTVPNLKTSFDVRVDLERPLELGQTSAGGRRIIPIIGGTITGDIEAEILPGGADWQRVRADGTLEIDGRYSARTPGGELIFLSVAGIRTGSSEVLAALGRGEAVDPAEYYFRTVVTLETSAEGLAWAQRALFIASCVREATTVRYTAYRVG